MKNLQVEFLLTGQTSPAHDMPAFNRPNPAGYIRSLRYYL